MTDSDVAAIDLRVAGKLLHVELRVPRHPTRPERMLPVFQSLADTLVGAAVGTVEATGARISCTKGCGACCRQLVPISDVEARGIGALVRAMPRARRAEIVTRFAAARQRLHGSGLLPLLQDTRQIGDEAIRSVGLSYFALGLACPFLEDESCSIHADRPLACREYLVTSPPAHCAAPSAASVTCVPMPAPASRALRRLAQTDGASGWVPLSLALEWADTHPDASRPRSGGAWLKEMIGHLTGAAIPG